MHILPRHQFLDELMLRALTIPVIAISVILAVLSVVSFVLWLVGIEYYQVPS